MLNEIKQLLALQQIDAELTDLAVHIRHLRAHRDQLEGRIELEESAVREQRDALAALRHDSRQRNLSVDELDMNIRAYQQRLDVGIISFKEMEDLRTKIELERARMSRMEDEALDLMDRIETAAAALREAEARFQERREEVAAQIADIDRQIAETETEVAKVEGERARAVAEIPAYLSAQYEALRVKFADPVAIIEHGTCSGCKLKVSGNTTERARGSMGIVTCEHCARILYIS